MLRDHIKLSEVQLIESEFGSPLEEAYKFAVSYFKEVERQGSVSIPYEDRIKLLALNKQIRFGPAAHSSESAGWFNFIGSDIQKAWKALEELGKEEAMASFVFVIDRVCPPFKNLIGSRQELLNYRERDCRTELSQVSEIRDTVKIGSLSAETSCTSVSSKPNFEIFEAQRKQIQESLNAQTFHQFSAYALQQYPGEPEKQAALIRQFQDQHYQQYMSQVYAQQAEAAAPESERKRKPPHSAEEQQQHDDDSDVSDEDPGEDLPSNPAIAPASLWNRHDIVEFKNNIKREGNEGVLKVGHGETVTIRVPTHEDGTCLFWEFATDYYDIGFGVYFEWTIADSCEVSIHVSESDDEEEFEEGNPEEGAVSAPPSNDIESGGIQQRRQQDPNRPRQDEIIPIYRRDCHEDVYAGSHVYPGRGVYLLKFDNSFSLWRSKTLYYRVYYSK